MAKSAMGLLRLKGLVVGPGRLLHALWHHCTTFFSVSPRLAFTESANFGPNSEDNRIRRSLGENMSLSSVSQIWPEVDPALWLVTARAGDAQGGMIATFVNQASIAPEFPRMLVGLSHQHHTRQLVETSGGFALHLFEEDHLDWVWQFGLQSGWTVDKLHGVAFDIGTTGSPLLREARAWLDCRIEARLNTGDRTIYLAEVVD